MQRIHKSKENTMFGFFKEIIDSFKEGVEEGKAELVEEAAAEKQKAEGEQAAILAQIEGIPYDEKFGVALGAHFRCSYFNDWFTVFKEDPDDNQYPIHLYTCGSYAALDENKKGLAKILKRDFDITDQKSCLYVLAMFFSFAGIAASESPDGDAGFEELNRLKWDVSQSGVSALLVAVTSHIVSAGVDVGYIEKADGVSFLRSIASYAKACYQGWNEFNENFFIGEAIVGLNNKAGIAVLEKKAGYLMTKKGSPWNNIDW
jgi:hypothetical protein